MKKTFPYLSIIILPLLMLSCQSRQVKNTEVISSVIHTSNERIDHQSAEAIGKNYAVATQGIYSTKAAQEIFSLGGNAIDAAIAASFVLAVERPHSTGLGGGGFMLFHDGKTKKTYAIDFRERAPLKSFEKMFLDKDGNINSNQSINGLMASGTPGLVAGLLEIHQKFGKLSRAKILAPAITLAEVGFPIYPSLEKALVQREAILQKNKDARKIFLDQNLKALPLGHILIQHDLANTLKRISRYGKNGFYKGYIANQIVKLSKNENGLISRNDLKSYQVKWRTPLIGQYKGFEIYSMPPPSSGGVHVIQFLNILENDNLKDIGFGEAKSIHLAASALQLAFADRARYLGDPDFIKVPTEELITKQYANIRRSQISENKAKASTEVKAGNIAGFEHTETTHLSIMDNLGNVVSTTQTINGYMGSGIVVPSTGIVLNNEMDDFSAKPGASNLFGAIGGKANAIAPRKTPLSSMSPTIVLKDGNPVMSLGAPGGTRIISCVAQTILNYLEFKLPLYESVAAIRYHHQWVPDVLDIDPPGPRPDVLKELNTLGHKVKINPVPCNVMATTKENNLLHAVSDPRDIGTSTAQ